MLRIFHVPGSRSLRLVWLAEEMGLPYEVKIERMEHPSAELLSVNPVGTIPAMQDGAVVMTESVAIMLYLTERYGPTPLTLKADHPRYPDYLQFLVFGEGSLAAFLNPVFRTLYGAPAEEKQNFTVDASKTLFKRRLRAVDDQLKRGDYMAGDFTIADISVAYSLGIGAFLGLDAEYSEAIKAYYDRLKARPAYQAAIR